MLILLAAVLMTSLTPAPLVRHHAAGPDWDLLGTRVVSFAADHDVVAAGRQGAFRAIKIEVEGGDLEMFDVRVVFGNGEVFSPTTRLLFRQGSWSRTIDLPGGDRIIRRIDFRYRSTLRRGRAVVRVFGRE